MNRKHFLMATLISVVLLTLVFIPLSGQEDGSYDPWIDTNDDGIIDVNDLQTLASIYGTSGESINKTDLLLELQSRIVALETRIPERGNISVPAAEFVAVSSDRYVAISPPSLTQGLYNWEEPPLVAIFVGSVQLPQGSTITNMTSYWYDIGPSPITCYLHRYNQTQGEQVMSYLPSLGLDGYGSSYDDIIDYATVDNNQYVYYLRVWVPSSDTHTDYYFQYAIIEYEY